MGPSYLVEYGYDAVTYVRCSGSWQPRYKSDHPLVELDDVLLAPQESANFLQLGFHVITATDKKRVRLWERYREDVEDLLK